MSLHLLYILNRAREICICLLKLFGLHFYILYFQTSTCLCLNAPSLGRIQMVTFICFEVLLVESSLQQDSLMRLLFLIFSPRCVMQPAAIY